MTTTATGSSLEHALGPDGIFTIRLRDGDIRLRAVEGDTMRVRDVHGSDLDAMFAIGLGDGNASLRATKHGGHSGRHGREGTPDLEIEVPRRATVVIEAESADIEADGLLGDQRYRTASGDMKLRAVSGRIAIEAVSGDIDVVATGEAAVTIRTVSGDIALRAATLTSLEAATTSGDLRIAGRLAGPGPFALVTVSGDALLAPAGDVRIEMATLSGDLHSRLGGRSEGGRGRRSLVVGSGGPLVSVRSMSGDLLVVPPTPIETTPPGSSAGAGSDVPAPMPPMPPTATPILEADYDDARLRILRSLEAGEIDVAEAGRRLEALDGEPVDPGTDTTRTATPEPTDA
jgi:Putative adhesin